MHSSIKKNISGVTLMELLLVIGIIALLSVAVVSVLINFRNSEALIHDTETVVEVLRQARSQTLTSQNASPYGVHFSSSKITLFTGGTYTNGTPSNADFPFTSSDTVLTVNLIGGGNDVVFKRLSGETGQSGTVVLRSATSGHTKTVTIYQTGLTESN